MATVQGNIALRETNLNTPAAIALAFNTLHDLIVGSGMTQVADDEFTGQAKVFSESAGVGLTQVVRNTSVAGSKVIIGYKVYRHPVLLSYFKINFIDQIITANSHAMVGFGVQFGKTLQGGGFKPATDTSMFYSLPFMPSGAPSETVISFSLEPITVSCGPSFFWIARKKGLLVSSTNANNMAFPHSYIDPLSFSFFSSDKNPDIACIVVPQSIALYASSGYSAEYNTVQNLVAVSYYAFDGSIWTNRGACAAGFLQNPVVSNTENGIRVAQAEMVVSGKQHRFNFGFINASVLIDYESVNINLNGVTQTYLHLPSIGTASPSYTKQPQASMCTVLMPII